LAYLHDGFGREDLCEEEVGSVGRGAGGGGGVSAGPLDALAGLFGAISGLFCCDIGLFCVPDGGGDLVALEPHHPNITQDTQ